MASFVDFSANFPHFCLFCAASFRLCPFLLVPPSALHRFRSSGMDNLFHNLVAHFVGNGNVKGYEIENDVAFSGGQNSQTVTTVQQSDIDNTTHTLEAANSPEPQQIFRAQIHANEQLLNAAQCKPNVSSNRAAGEQAPSVTVTITFTCTGEVYGQSAALALAQKLLANQAKDSFGPRWTLQGSIAATITRAVLSNAGRGTITLTANTSGTWVADFDDPYLQAPAASIAGKTRQEVQAILSANKDISGANIQIPASNGDTLPTDVHQIKIVTSP